jgi:hypothetical protein
MGSIHDLGNLTAIGLSDFSSSARKTSVQPGDDQVQLATVPLAAQVEQLQRTDASSLQAVLSDAIRKLRSAASESSDPVEAGYLSDLANRFQWLEEAGNADALSNPAQDPTP